jgi:hypothetical protein
MKDITGHGKRSAKQLKNLGFKLTQEEFLAIRFHMSLKDKTTHPLYNDALKSQLRYVVHKADSISAKLCKGYDEPRKKRDKLEPYLQNITKLDCKEIIYQVKDGWFMNLHSPYDGEIDPELKDKIIGIKMYSTAEPIAINDSFHVAVFVLGDGDKKALFVMHHHFGMQGGCYFSPDKEPFIYSDVKVYCDWGNLRPWGNNSAFHCDFGFVKAIKPYNILAVGLGFAELLCLSAQNLPHDLPIIITSVIFAVFCVAIMIAAKKGAEKWTI